MGGVGTERKGETGGWLFFGGSAELFFNTTKMLILHRTLQTGATKLYTFFKQKCIPFTKIYTLLRPVYTFLKMSTVWYKCIHFRKNVHTVAYKVYNLAFNVFSLCRQICFKFNNLVEAQPEISKKFT